MTEDDDAPLHLTRMDPARNMARFYMLALQPTLFGGVSVIRNWGRIGTRGQAKIETYDDGETAEDARNRIENTKRRRGYC
ncbi:putative DNA-binding WGR domain protein [Rhizobium sp. PP-F2F-G48]|uniref:WGR domain-containing protein n=1 Tax=Rhizobium sp. PP-F2F-G48 TaxID=2135651 RepID=UPI00104D28FA|nr:WGR domain-containing protein [Rhizobium sp. PP-F2F-G48]TCM51096.1 putative DNA-binding WGR domain protein [Rhizobium sp. PP-F2F-G48]